MALNEKEYIKQFDLLRQWIRDSVQAFKDDTPEARQSRIELASRDKFFFAKTYFPHYCTEDFAPVHAKLFAIGDVYNQPVAIYGARGIAKSTILDFLDEMHKTLFKKNFFTIFIADSKEVAASEYLIPIKAELELNERILNDFGSMVGKYWGFEDFTLTTGKRFLASGPKVSTKGKRARGRRYDRVIIVDFESQLSTKKKSLINRRLKFIKTDVMKGTNSKRWQVFFEGNYFSKKTIMHQLITGEDYSHWLRYGFPALIPESHQLAKQSYLSHPDTKPELIRNTENDKLVSIWEAGLPLAMLMKEKKDDPVTFRTEREQKPEDEEGTFKEEWFKYYTKAELDFIEHLPVVTYHDPSALKGEEHCYKAIITLAVDIKNMIYYVLNVWIKKTSKWNSINEHFKISKKYLSSIDAVEANGYQSTLREDYELIEEKVSRRLNLKLINNRLPKEVRISSLASPIERGYIRFLQDAEDDTEELIDQLVDFPDGEFVDGPDALEGAKQTADTFILKIKRKVGAKCL